MTPDDVMAAILEAQALNHAQARLGYNPSEECDSILEHARELYRTASPEQKPHLREIVELVRELLCHNADERALEREVAGVVDLLGACREREKWTIRAIAGALRAPIATVMQPLTGHVALEQALDAIIGVLAEVPAERVGTHQRPNATLSHELGPRKYGWLLGFVASREAVPA